WARFPDIVRSADGELRPTLKAGATVLAAAIAGALVAIVLLALVDLLYQRWQHERDLRMTKQEVREDLKQSEGDPHLKARVRQVQRELASRRMMEEVPKATVVVTNPTHFAVALRYELDAGDGERLGAPRVVAKGADLLAQRIKHVAREHAVPCYEDVPLARSLYARAEVGREVPEDLYEAVATVISFVYRTRRGRPAAALAER
ncbi:MAG TPA: EscU/YscU/HrcU family type III secretion system export apparatus switch protein, partial [Planctomycetota bacterium]|nr:EscU/YscU/HrcU family type III secretion system export apparatus switch protein [Planctomycetota bacterium]